MVDTAPHAAIANLQYWCERDPDVWWHHAALAELYEHTGRETQAAEHRAILDRWAPDTAEAWYLRSFVTRDGERALALAEQAVDRDPDHVFAWTRLAFLRRQLFLGEYPAP